ncbi:expressed integral membrane protein [Fragilariopsis cylindrus CCMP1102]|uniref:Expressed integral membrane protein n=1 Tax=Fragilariopsis cylindrus CCMP1102 TaxID=635003 RepID=A0A1E7EP90_9STRA|nr:expressed integral membrane protein [Fragilariopsis cylindrus CCMP1102]|eukprot:OEU07761.1 expressed integral membrane protein [Fragilariopsis cylindrus CCMP1102]
MTDDDYSLPTIISTPRPAPTPATAYSNTTNYDTWSVTFVSTCDESKCLSTGLKQPPPATTSSSSSSSKSDDFIFNCYGLGPNTMFPFICADNYTGVEVLLDDDGDNVMPSVTTNQDNSNLKYYTCCPPEPKQTDEDNNNNNVDGNAHYYTEIEEPPTRHCENSQYLDETKENAWNVTSWCEAPSSYYPYGRAMTNVPGIPLSYMCCDQELTIIDDDEEEGSSISNIFNPNPDCVQDMFCESCTVITTNNYYFGNLPTTGSVMNCYNDIYQYPQIIINTGHTVKYECCSVSSNSTTSSNGSFIILNSTAFQATIWTQFVLALLSTIISVLLIVAISLPLYRNKNNNKETNNKSSTKNNNNRRKKRAKINNSGSPDYSSYNLYLIFLSIPDLLFNLYLLGTVTGKYYSGWNQSTDGYISSCATINMYMNAIIAREVMILLRRTKHCQRYSPPSYKKASIQFSIVSVYAIILGIVWYFLLHNWTSSDDDDNSSSSNITTTTGSDRDTFTTATAIPLIQLRNYSISTFFILVVGIPLLFLVYICFIIWYQKLLPNDQIGRNSRRNVTNTSNSNYDNHSSNNSASRTKIQRISGFLSRMKSSRHNNTSTSNTTTDSAKSSIFFFIWFPGMIMYYIAYVPDRASSGLLHNLGLLFFSLQGIISGGMVMSKPDVRKSIYDLYDITIRKCIIIYVKKCKQKPSKSTDNDNIKDNIILAVDSGAQDSTDNNNSNSNSNNDHDHDNSHEEDKRVVVLVESLPKMIDDGTYNGVVVDVEAPSSTTQPSNNKELYISPLLSQQQQQQQRNDAIVSSAMTTTPVTITTFDDNTIKQKQKKKKNNKEDDTNKKDINSNSTNNNDAIAITIKKKKDNKKSKAKNNDNDNDDNNNIITVSDDDNKKAVIEAKTTKKKKKKKTKKTVSSRESNVE